MTSPSLLACFVAILGVGVVLGLLLPRKRSERPEKPKMNTSTKVLIALGVFLLVFIVAMIVTYWVTGGVPDTLISCVLDTGKAEAVVLAAIKISKVIKGKTEEESA